MPNFVRRESGLVQPLYNGQIVTLPIANRARIGVTDSSGLDIGPNNPSTNVLAWKELPPEGNTRWFQATGFHNGYIMVEARQGSNLVCYIQIAVPPLSRNFSHVLDFLNKTLYVAHEASCNRMTGDGISLSALLGHSALESQWGKSILCRGNNVWFGFTCESTYPRAVQAGPRWFRSYTSFSAALQDYLQLVKRIYPGAWAVRKSTDNYINVLSKDYDRSTAAQYPGLWRQLLVDGNLRELENLKDCCP